MSWFRIQFCEYCERYNYLLCDGKDDDDVCLDFKCDKVILNQIVKELYKNETNSKDK